MASALPFPSPVRPKGPQFLRTGQFNYFALEPVGGSAPKFSALSTLTILPSTILSLVQHKGLLSLPTGQSYSDSLLEPVGGSAPKFPAESSISNLARVSASSLSLTCPAQGAPVPAYRRVITHKPLPRTCRRIDPKVSLWDDRQPGQTFFFLFGPFLPSPGRPCPGMQASF